jgi:hypothetical protein
VAAAAEKRRAARQAPEGRAALVLRMILGRRCLPGLAVAAAAAAAHLRPVHLVLTLAALVAPVDYMALAEAAVVVALLQATAATARRALLLSSIKPQAFRDRPGFSLGRHRLCVVIDCI